MESTALFEFLASSHTTGAVHGARVRLSGDAVRRIDNALRGTNRVPTEQVSEERHRLLPLGNIVDQVLKPSIDELTCG